jgi:hypothetical protein
MKLKTIHFNDLKPEYDITSTIAALVPTVETKPTIKIPTEHFRLLCHFKMETCVTSDQITMRIPLETVDGTPWQDLMPFESYEPFWCLLRNDMFGALFDYIHRVSCPGHVYGVPDLYIKHINFRIKVYLDEFYKKHGICMGDYIRIWCYQPPAKDTPKDNAVWSLFEKWVKDIERAKLSANRL